jgi:hypothetical protein
MASNNTNGNFKQTKPIIPKATHFFMNSGNVVSSDRIKKRTNLNPQEEVFFFHQQLKSFY